MKILITITILLLSIFSSPIHQGKQTTAPVKIEAPSDVCYVCNSSTSYAYHSNPNCRGLKTVAEAEKDGRRACKLCY